MKSDELYYTPLQAMVVLAQEIAKKSEEYTKKAVTTMVFTAPGYLQEAEKQSLMAHLNELQIKPVFVVESSIAIGFAHKVHKLEGKIQIEN